jgi:hypothetical protein
MLLATRVAAVGCCLYSCAAQGRQSGDRCNTAFFAMPLLRRGRRDSKTQLYASNSTNNGRIGIQGSFIENARASWPTCDAFAISINIFPSSWEQCFLRNGYFQLPKVCLACNFVRIGRLAHHSTPLEALVPLVALQSPESRSLPCTSR